MILSKVIVCRVGSSGRRSCNCSCSCPCRCPWKPLLLLLSADGWFSSGRGASCWAPIDNVAFCRKLRGQSRTKATKDWLSSSISLHLCQSVTYRQRPVSRPLMLKCRVVSWHWLLSAAIVGDVPAYCRKSRGQGRTKATKYGLSSSISLRLC